MDNKINLKNTTFIIPIKIESEDRFKNSQITLKFLLSNFDTNIIIYESESHEIPNVLKYLEKNNIETSSIQYFHNDENKVGIENVFHRTAYLNFMLNKVKTPVVVNYDIDVILPIESYIQSEYMILNNSFKFIYPYEFGVYQKMVDLSIKDEILSINSSNKYFFNLLNDNCFFGRSEYGHCVFCSTISYIENGCENENFISYGPEDKERYYRFFSFGNPIGRINKGFVYHLEHHRKLDSSSKNPYFKHNIELYNNILSLSIKELKDYYK